MIPNSATFCGDRRIEVSPKIFRSIRVIKAIANKIGIIFNKIFVVVNNVIIFILKEFLIIKKT